ncbi:MAG: hypothetical protein QOE24_2502, partial [Frankiales bacterium]|nr:hypothetical protein [Frankiales bacterium]
MAVYLADVEGVEGVHEDRPGHSQPPRSSEEARSRQPGD